MHATRNGKRIRKLDKLLFSVLTFLNIHWSEAMNSKTRIKVNRSLSYPKVRMKFFKLSKSKGVLKNALDRTIESENEAALKNENEKRVKPKVKSMLRLL